MYFTSQNKTCEYLKLVITRGLISGINQKNLFTFRLGNQECKNADCFLSFISTLIAIQYSVKRY